MSIDTITEGLTPDRLYYGTGILLAADDLAAEQSYHRGRLARALAYLHGSGTVAGLRVDYQPEAPATDTQPGQAEQIVVNPGMAVDRLGRIIEVPRQACIRLDRWYVEQTADALNLALHAEPFNGVVVDVYLRFVVCERGKTPAFAAGPFDALDAVAPSRLRDGYELRLILRSEENPPLPLHRWPDLSGIADPAERRRVVHDFIFNAWPRNTDRTNLQQPEPGGEYAIDDEELTGVFLARVVIGADANPTPGEPPLRRPPQIVNDPETGEPQTVYAVTIDNDSRLFLYTTRLLAVQDGL